jgi:hypothetical protein
LWCRSGAPGEASPQWRGSAGGGNGGRVASSRCGVQLTGWEGARGRCSSRSGDGEIKVGRSSEKLSVAEECGDTGLLHSCWPVTSHGDAIMAWRQGLGLGVCSNYGGWLSGDG